MAPLRSRSLLAGLLLAIFGISVLPGAAAAGPKANLNQVQRQVDQLNRQAEQAAERYNTAKVELTDTTRQLRAARNKYASTQRRLDAMKLLVGRIAVASYKSGGLDSSMQLLLSSNPTGFLRQAADLTQVTKHQDHLPADRQSARLATARALLGRLQARQRLQLMSIRQAATDRALGARSDAMRASRSSRNGD